MIQKLPHFTGFLSGLQNRGGGGDQEYFAMVSMGDPGQWNKGKYSFSGHLKALIGEAESRGLRFVYAISPGQDIVFSSSCDLTLLKRKLRQVAELGCHAFTLLFDDIDHSMCQADKEAFSSFAHAQVTVANEIFRFLGNPPVFLFCPTEYCSSLCTPSVSKSPYLLTIGEDLLPGISIIWTGKRVISRDLCADSLAEVQSVIRRPPLIWDNLHANDYDSRRVFLGPFKGRSPGLRAHLRGLLLNPNCEFEANFIPLHTLGSWHKEGKEERKGDEEGYGVERALSVALQDWMKELCLPLHPGRQVRSTDPKPSLSSVKSKSSDSSENQHEAKPKTSITSSWSSGALASDEIPAVPATHQDLEAGLYYLPHEHGPPAQSLLQDLTWLKANCHSVSVNGKKTPQQKAEEWRGRAGRFLAACDDVALLHSAMVNSVNRAVLYDLYPYIWDLRNTLLVAKAFICCLEGRIMSESSQLGSWKNCFHWCGASSGAELLGMEAEPWVFKGGLSGEVQMLLPVGTSNELFSHPPPLFPTCRLYNIRPFQQKDKVELYHMVHQLYQRGRGSQDATISHPDFIGDRCLGASLALCPEYSLVLEDELGVCGCAVGILDVRLFAKRCQATWLPAMRDKYLSLPHGHAATKEALLYFHEEQDYPDSQLYHFPSQLRLEALPELVDCSISRSLITALLTALKANGSPGVFCEVQPTDGSRIEFLTKLGFLEILRGEARSREGVVLGRLL
ncbi:Protein O-GlcNAcase [Triplophysa tibetana]|uniref:Protein O-GlcNAcase n=1 Tax=Triplophysa tibetana TaxID=1572043 RepID=A0A5A9PMS3_9TELE|nr:Protein O-GlcNAcase [Triplophysa tibetana]